MKRKLIIFIAICLAMLLIGVVINYSYQSYAAKREFDLHVQSLIRVCPDSYIVNRMPGVTMLLEHSLVDDYILMVKEKIIGKLLSEYLNREEFKSKFEGGYFILDDKRKELYDFDLSWLSVNCDIRPSYVY